MKQSELATGFRTSRNGRSSGFSLIELIIGIGIIGILAAIGIAAMPRDRMQAREAARMLAGDLNRARTEGIRLNTNVAIDFDNAACRDYCIYADYTRSGSPDDDLDNDGVSDVSSTFPDAKLLDRSLSQDFPRVTVTSADFGSSPRIWFDVRGLPRASTGAYFATTGVVVLRPISGEPGYLVKLEPQGRVQVSKE
jgi:prepilin-type N-terminal cleavage/methylation domain-containing protein